MHDTMKRLLDYARAKRPSGPTKVADFSDIGRDLGASSAVITNWKSRGISKEGAINASAFYGCSITWLLTGTGAQDDRPELEEVDFDNLEELQPIRSVILKLSAGCTGFVLADMPEDGEPLYIPKTIIKELRVNPNKLISTKVSGQSMEPTLFHNDVILLNIGSNEPKDGRVFAVNYEGEAVIKRMVRSEGFWWLSSDNPDKTRFPLKKCSDPGCKMVGEVVYRQSLRI